MTDVKPAETQVDAASDDKVPAPEAKTKKQDSVETTVFVPSGPVAKSEVIKTAIHSVRDAIPVVYELNAEITNTSKTTRKKGDETVSGTLFTVTVTYTPRGEVGKQEPVDVKAVIKGLEAPRFPGFHEGDPNFGSDPEA